jgi:hypothetical protein
VRGARTGLIHVHHELIAQAAAEDLVSRADDGLAPSGIKTLELEVGLGGGTLHQHGGSNQAVGRGQAANRKVRAGARCLDTVVRLGRHVELAERIPLNAMSHREIVRRRLRR